MNKSALQLYIGLSVALVVVQANRAAKVVSSANEIANNGRYHYHYDLDTGLKVQQEGVLKHVPGEYAGEAIHGQYAFIAKDGHEYVVSYVADELGYRPSGEHLPTPPPIPAAIVKQLKYLEAHPWTEPARSPKRR